MKLGVVAIVVAGSALLGATALRPAPARASVVQALSLEALTRKSDVIVVGVAREQQARMHADGVMIVTDFSLEVETALKGDAKAGSTVVATVLGGRLGQLALQVPGEASFALGQRVIAFLYRSPKSGDLRVVGMSQGVMPLLVQNGATMVLPGGSGAALVDHNAQGQMVDAQPALAQPMPIGELLDRIRQLVQSQ